MTEAATVTAATLDARLQAIWQVVARLPAGEIASYGQVAARAGLPGRARLVGRALRLVPDGVELPWHRVVGAGGRIAFAAGSPAAQLQAQRLRAEGLEVDGRRVRLPPAQDLDALLWGGAGAAKMRRSTGDGE